MSSRAKVMYIVILSVVAPVVLLVVTLAIAKAIKHHRQGGLQNNRSEQSGSLMYNTVAEVIPLVVDPITSNIIVKFIINSKTLFTIASNGIISTQNGFYLSWNNLTNVIDLKSSNQTQDYNAVYYDDKRECLWALGTQTDIDLIYDSNLNIWSAVDVKLKEGNGTILFRPNDAGFQT